METDKRLKMTGYILDFFCWDDTINEYVGKFHKKYNVYPNILEANEFTLNRIDLIAQKNPDRIISSDDGGTIETSNIPFNGISTFNAEDYSLEMCLDYDLDNGTFTLIFDEDPDFSGEEIPDIEENEEKLIVYYFDKKSA